MRSGPKNGCARIKVQEGHGHSTVEDNRCPISWRINSACFNGATAFRPWKTPACAGNITSTVKLQWGQPFSTVEDVDAVTPLRRHASVLQWGHGLSTVDNTIFLTALLSG